MTCEEKLSAIQVAIDTDGEVLTDGEVVDAIIAILGEQK